MKLIVKDKSGNEKIKTEITGKFNFSMVVDDGQKKYVVMRKDVDE